MSDKPINIFLVDDHGIVLEGLRSLLEKQEGCLVVGEASHGQKALDQIRSCQPDVVIMDMHLPGGSGLEISRIILAERPSIKIIALSADSDMALIQEALQAGIAAYLMKETAPRELMRAIRAVMDQQIYLCPELSSVVVKNYLQTLSETIIPASQPLLTDRERLLLKLVAEGQRNKEIAEALEVGVKSVENYRSRLMKKLGCASTTELVRYAIREGITSL